MKNNSILKKKFNTTKLKNTLPVPGNGAKNLTSVEIVNFKFIISELLVAEVSSGRTLETGSALQFKS